MVLSDWSHDATTFEIIDCRFSKDWQNQELLRLANAPIDAVISLPIGASGVLEGHRAVVNAGKKLVLLDNAPSGLRPGVDYLSVSSADNFGIGAIAAELTSPHLPNEGVVGILTYESGFFVTNEREIGFRKWMGAERPDATLVRGRFASVEEAGAAYERLLTMNDDLDCAFVAWDVPALRVLAAIKQGARTLPIVTVDLGVEIAEELRKGGPLKGIAAQRPFDQGAAAASAALMGLVGRSPPGWMTSEGLKVTRENLDAACDALWRKPALPPQQLP